MLLCNSNKRKVTKMDTPKKLIIIGSILLIVLNPFAVNVEADLLIIAINELTKWLVISSSYIMAIGGTLIVVGVILAHEANRRKEVKRLKSLKNKKTEKAGEFIG